MTKKKKKEETLQDIRDELETAEQKVEDLREKLKNKQNEEIVNSSNDMFKNFKEVAGDVQMEDMMAFFKQAIANAKPEDFEEETDEAIATAEDDETEAVEETEEVSNTSSFYENNTY